MALLAPGLSSMFPADTHSSAPGYGPAVIAFEMARTPADLTAVFGPVGDASRPGRLAMMDKGNTADFVFIVAYGLFTALFALAVRRSTGRFVWGAVACLAVLAGFADAIENVLLLRITGNLTDLSALTLLAWPVCVKFVCIMVSVIACGRHIMTAGSVPWRLAGAAAIAGGALVVPGLIKPASYAVLISLGISVAWTVMLAYAVMQWLKLRA